jgi:hypothetical protein
MSYDLAGETAKNMLKMGLDTSVTNALLEMFDAYDELLREILANDILGIIYNDNGIYPEPHWKIFENGFQQGIEAAVTLVRKSKS